MGNVNAADKSTGKAQSITITNDKGRLSKEDIERMVNEAEKYKAEDEAVKERLEAKNGLESFAYNLKQTVDDEKMKDKIDAGDKESLLAKVNETISWLDNNQQADKEEYEAKQKELQETSTPIMQKMYAAAGAGGGMPGGMPDMSGMGGAGAPPPSSGAVTGPPLRR